MIHLAHRLIRADLTALPGRAVAVAALLLPAALLSTFMGSDATYGVVVAAAVASCATLGAVALDEARDRLLDDNGARPWAVGLVAAASMVPPAVVATVLALAIGALLDPGPAVVEVVLLALVVPVLAAPLTVWVAGRAARSSARPGRPGVLATVGNVAGGAVLVLLAVVMPPLAVALVALKLTAGSWSSSRVARAGGALLALAVVGVMVLAVGNSTTWFDMSLVLLFGGPGLVVAVVVLGMHAVTLGSGAAAHAGPRARLALAPLVGRRRMVAPLVGVVCFVAAMSVSQAVVGASFGEREANRERDLPTLTAVAGNRADQAIVVMPPVDVAQLRAIAAERTAGTSAAAVVIEQVGFRAPAVNELLFGAIDLSAFGGGVSVLTTGPAAPGADEDPAAAQRWVGVVAPEDLAALGWSSAEPALDAGQVVLTSGVQPSPGGTASVIAAADLVELPAVAVDGPTGGALLPAGIVSAPTAAELSPLRTTARLVVVPDPDAPVAPSLDELRGIAGLIQNDARALPVVTPAGLTGDQVAQFDLLRATIAADTDPVVSGQASVVLRRSGPLNDLPVFARTAEQGRGQLVGLAALAVLMTVAGVLLALGATRSDDVVLEVQGAPTGVRSQVSAIQAAAVSVPAALFAVALGIGVPALAFRVYNGSTDLPEIPLVVPGLVWAVAAAIPVLAVILSAAIPAIRRPAGPDRLAALGGT